MAILKINGDTSGSVSLTVPAAAGTNTVTVPAETGTVLTTASSGVCRAWVNFNGTGTVAIRASFNVSSITDNGTGDYSINLTTALTDANFVMSGSGALDTANTDGNFPSVGLRRTALSASSPRIVVGTVGTGTYGAYDAQQVQVAFFR